MEPKKSLGQHWLKDPAALLSVCSAADITPTDIVLEIGPGLGDLTKLLVSRAKQVIAVEIDNALAANLPKSIQAANLRVVRGDILQFDLTELPPGYKVVANIPYYLTSNLIRNLSESINPPQQMVLLVQKEVAQRVAARPGDMSLLSVSAQLYYSATLGAVIPAELFEPAPKVDSQIISLKRHTKPLFDDLDHKVYFKLVKAGFAGRRKKLRGSLAAGLGLTKDQADQLLITAKIDPNLRAQNLSLEDWHKLYIAYKHANMELP